MVEHSFDVGLGVYSFAPSPNKKIVRNPFWKEELVKKMAEYNGIHENVIRKDLGMELIEG
jgi:hypothetical protein